MNGLPVCSLGGAVGLVLEDRQDGVGIKRLWVLGDGHGATEAGEDGQSDRQRLIERINGHGLQAVRVAAQGPALGPVLIENGPGVGVEALQKGFVRHGALGQLQRLDDPQSDLGGGLVGKGDANHRFRRVDAGQGAQRTADEQAGLAGSRGGDGDDVAVQAQCTVTGLLISRRTHEEASVSSCIASSRTRMASGESLRLPGV